MYLLILNVDIEETLIFLWFYDTSNKIYFNFVWFDEYDVECVPREILTCKMSFGHSCIAIVTNKTHFSI